MEPILTTLAILTGSAVGIPSSVLIALDLQARLLDHKLREWQAREFTDFRGQHFKFLKNYQIIEAVKQAAKGMEKCVVSPHSNSRRTFMIARTWARDKAGKSEPKRLYLRCSLESYSKFRQVIYEWSGDDKAMSDPGSIECRTMQQFVDQAERLLFDLELERSLKHYTLGGSVIYNAAKTFNADIAKVVLADAISVTNDAGKTIDFKISMDVRQRQKTGYLEAYVTVDSKRELQIRFFAMDKSLPGLPACEFRCDWTGSYTAEAEPDSDEWNIVRALFNLVQKEAKKRGALPCLPTEIYEHTIALGIYETWSYKGLQQLCRTFAGDLMTYGVKDKNTSRTLHAMEKKDKQFPGAIELCIGSLKDENHRVTNATIELCIQFIPLPPKCGEVLLHWSLIKGKLDIDAELMVKFLEKTILSKLERVMAKRVNGPPIFRVQFQEQQLKEMTKLSGSNFSWPTPQDYNESLQSAHICFADPELKTGAVSLNALGIPRAATGAFASVYKMSLNERDWAIRCFNTPVKDQIVRYERIAKFVFADDLPYTVPCQFIEKGINVSAHWFPIVKMEWVEGTPLNSYIATKLADKNALASLRSKLARMMADLNANGIAHGDLQHGNIIIRDDEFVLVDYDNMFVPELAGFVSWETGHRNYQHPHRNSKHFGPYLDNFSAWIIDSALLFLMHDSKLWKRFGEGDESLLFTAIDFLNPDNSELFQMLQKHRNPEVSGRAHALRSFLDMQPEQVPHLTT